MSKLLKIFGVIVGIIIIFCLFVFFGLTHLNINAETVYVVSTSVSDTRIDIKLSSSASAGGYTGFKAKFSNGILVITLKGTNFDTPISRIIPFLTAIGSISLFISAHKSESTTS